MRRTDRRATLLWLLGTIVVALTAYAGDCTRDTVPPDRCAYYDTDCDSISVAVEIDSIDHSLYGFDTTVKDRNPSRALGTPTDGQLDSGIHLPDLHPGYYHFPGSDTLPGGAPAHTDDWGALALANTVERAGLCWPYRVPRGFGVGDLSRPGGGSWLPDHASHQNGRDADVRYVRRDRDTLPLDLRFAGAPIDTDATIHLWNCLIQYSPWVQFIIIDSVFFGDFIERNPKLVFDTSRVHANHFHVRIIDPDGNN